jgi:hypothetical protein
LEVARGVQLEVNGVVRDVRLKVPADGTKLTAKGNASTLGLVPGPNRVRLILAGKRSNIVVVTL